MPEGEAYKKLVDKVKANDIIRGKLLSEDGDLALIVLALDPDVASGSKLAGVVDEIRKTMKEDLDGTNLQAELSGVPVMQLEIRNAVERDRLLYNAIGFPGRLPDCHPVLPARLLHDHRGRAAAESPSCWRSAAWAGWISA